MLECYACAHRFYRALYTHTLNRALSPETPTSPIIKKKPRYILAVWPRRNESTLAIYAKRNLSGKELQCLGYSPKFANHTLQQPGQWHRRNGPSVAIHPKRNVMGWPRPIRGSMRQSLEHNQLAKEMQYLGDPLKLANNIVQLLQQPGQAEKAEEMVRTASKSMECTVSWNHLIDFYMSTGRVAQAMSTYNDMKKRGQHPDGHTYTIILRGLGSHSDLGKSLPRALTVYHSMFAPGSRVTPSIIHTNAALRVCAQAGDLDAMFGVAARLPKSGPHAADRATFTTIFNALTRIVYGDNEVGQTESMRDNIDKRQNAVLLGRKMWAEIVERWGRGDILLDEEFVCAMGRLLLLADVPQDLDDVLSLLEQTMGIPRQIRPRSFVSDGTPEATNKNVENPAQENNDLEQAIEPGSKPFPDVEDEFVPGTEFSPIPNMDKSAWVIPSRNTLSLVVDACTRLKLFAVAQDYWGLLTGPTYKIVPDTANYHMYLRLLRAQRASRQCVSLVREMRDGLGADVSSPPRGETGGVQGKTPLKGEKTGGVEVKTFRIALSACKRDIHNINVVGHAQKLVWMMYQCFSEADVTVLNTYVEIVREAIRDDCRAMCKALRSTEIGVRQMQAALRFGLSDGEKRKSDKFVERCEKTEAFARKLIGAYDHLLVVYKTQMLYEDRGHVYKQIRELSVWQTELAVELENIHKARTGSDEPERNWRKKFVIPSRDASRVAAEEEIHNPETPVWKRIALKERLHCDRYTQGGANKRMAMAQYLRRIRNESM